MGLKIRIGFAIFGLGSLAIAPSAFAFQYGKCVAQAPTLCHTDLLDASENVTITSTFSFPPTSTVQRRYSVGYAVNAATHSLVYVKVAPQLDPSACYGSTSKWEVSSYSGGAGVIPSECKQGLINAGWIDPNAKKNTVAGSNKKKTGTTDVAAADKTPAGKNRGGGPIAPIDDGKSDPKDKTAAKKDDGVANDDKVSADTKALIDNANKGKVISGDVVADAATGKDRQDTFRDTNGNGKQDAGEVVLSSNYGTKNSDGTLNTEFTEDNAPDGATGFKYSFYDPKTKKTFSTSDGTIAQQYAQKDGVGTVTVVDKATGQKYQVDASTGEVKKETKKPMTDEEKQASTDPCSVSARIGIKTGKDYRCQGTQNWAKGAEVANQVLTTAGRAVITSLGTTAAQNAQNGTFASSQEATAKMAKTSGTYETVLGVANLAATAKLAAAANKHKSAIGDLQQLKEGDGAKDVNFFKNGDGSVQSLKENGDLQARYDAAIKEQTGARNLAATAAFKTAMQAAQSISGALVSRKIAKDAQDRANQAKANDLKAAQLNFQYDTAGLAPPNGTVVGYDAGAMGGTGSQNNSPTTTTDNVDPNAPTGPMLGNGNDSGAGNSDVNAPGAGKFQAGTAGGGPGGGAGGGAPAVGGGGGSNGPGPQEEAKAAYASEFGTKERYENGGAAGPGGAKGGAGAKKDDPGIDLNGLLAQFLPKGEDEAGKHSILDSVSFGGNRNVANEEAPSYLDKNADLFQRIHETMSEKNRRGQLGI